MAIYHCRLKVTGQFVRPTGGAPEGATRRSAVAAAAYRSGERLWDNEQSKWCERNTARQHEVAYTSVLAPEGAPDWVYDRQQLWNAVERSVLNRDGSTRKPRVNKDGKMVNEGAQLYRECEVSIPREVWEADRACAIGLVEDFARDQFVSDGMVADIAIHDSDAADGHSNVHAHIMLTMRRLESDPQRIAAGHFFEKNRERDWDCPADLTQRISYANKKRDGALERFGKTGDAAAGREAEHWQAQRDELDALRPVKRIRRAWQDAANAALQETGSAARVDHRSLAAQRAEALQRGDMAKAASLDREPLPRLSPIAKHIREKAGIIADRANTYWAMNARRQFRQVAHAMQELNRGNRMKVFLNVTQVMQDMLDDWRENRSQRAMVPTVRLREEDIDR
ncbi:MobA/MobL family protein [Mameliella sp. CS4]|uniref:MobA/MobL family protein n=1 Tax=Mameliella sp. CS4 TaxID=2862329 RepID=UPI001C5F0951|nr:MobA/MobL family protein [Mameliella sp. CS4]MBW4985868.1 MobA/MobL family protein [Mameliella sp. CS4]